MHFVWGRYCNYRATRAIGTNLVAPIQQINLIFTLLLAILILGETLTPLRMLGIALVLLGPSFTLRERARRAGQAALGADVAASGHRGRARPTSRSRRRAGVPAELCGGLFLGAAVGDRLWA